MTTWETSRRSRFKTTTHFSIGMQDSKAACQNSLTVFRNLKLGTARLIQILFLGIREAKLKAFVGTKTYIRKPNIWVYVQDLSPWETKAEEFQV